MIAVTHFLRAPGPHNFSIERLHEDVRRHLPGDIAVTVATNRFPSRGVIARLRDAWAARRRQGQVNHVTGDTHYLACFLDRRRTVLTIHDCTLLETATGLRRLALWFLWYWLPAKRCARIVTISEASRRQLLTHIACPPGKIVVIPNCVSAEFAPLPAAALPARPRLLVVGTTANKNLDRIALAVAGLACRLVIVGPLSPSQRELLADHAVDWENHVGLSRQELLEQYRQCDLLLFPSLHEGFGMPIVEANAVGRPVIAGNVEAMPEVAGDAACLVDPHDPADIRRGLDRVLNDDAYRAELVAKGFANARRFSCDRVAARYAGLYREIAGA